MDDLNRYDVPIRRVGVFEGISTMQTSSVVSEGENEHCVDLEGLEFMLAHDTVPVESVVRVNEIVSVDKDYLPMVKDDSVREWVISKYNLQNETEGNIQKWIQDLQQEKTSVRKMARDYVHCFFVEALKNRGVRNVRTMKEIKDYWRSNKDDQNIIETMKYVMFGYFDEKANWDKLVERKILHLLHKKYVEAEENKKGGCIAKILREEKNEKVKQIQKPCKEEVKLGIRRKGVEGQNLGNKRRKKGSIYVNVNIQRISSLTVNNSNGEGMWRNAIRNAVSSVPGIGESEIDQILHNLSNNVVGI